MASDSPAIEQARTNATLLSLPREIRNMIYHHIYPETISKRPVTSPSKVANETGHHIEDRLTLTEELTSAVRKEDPANQTFAPLNINRQLRDEILPIFYQHYVFSFVEHHHASLPNCLTWLQSLPIEHLKLVRHVKVRVYLPGLSQVPVPWMRAEEELSIERGSNLRLSLDFPHENERYFWVLTYSECLKLRLAGMSWDQIDKTSNGVRYSVAKKLIEMGVRYHNDDPDYDMETL